jgi:hypothetical protein
VLIRSNVLVSRTEPLRIRPGRHVQIGLIVALILAPCLPGLVVDVPHS